MKIDCAATLWIGGVFAALASGPAFAETLRFSFDSDVVSLDPYTLNQTFNLGFLGNVYEGLTRRGPDLAIEPALATGWEMVEPTRWRFHLRQGVVFHNGDPFDADDVLFSAERVRSAASNLANRLAGVTGIIKVDPYTVDFVTGTPNPLLIAEWDTWFIMDREWAEANGAVAVTNVADQAAESYANRHANGTGPFVITEREPDVRTVAVPNPDWWDAPQHNLTEVVFQPIAADQTRVAALLSGEMDLILSVPVQDLARVEDNDGTHVVSGLDLRTIFLGMDVARDELLYSSVTGANPFRDVRVRRAVYQAIDIEAIRRVVMRGQAQPAVSLVAPGVVGYPEGLERWPYDPEAAAALMAEAGYADGFDLGMVCPNDRYVNDAEICQAVAGMLGRIGIRVSLETMPNAQYFGRILAPGGYDASFFLLGWVPATLDSHNTLFNFLATRNPEQGQGFFNIAGYSDPEMDDLVGRLLAEADPARRAALAGEAWQKVHDEVPYIPLHQQVLAWGVRDGVDLVQRADGTLLWRLITVH